MLSCCQKYADDHSFQFSMKKSQVIVFGDDVDFDYEWVLMSETMAQVAHYPYLGNTFGRCLGQQGISPPGVNIRREFVDMKFTDEGQM